MNVLSLFDGISCGQVALERAGINVNNYFASEIDKYAIQIALKNYPNTNHLGNVKDFDLTKLPKIDLLIGGSPCQDLSKSKNDAKGLEGDNSSLFYDYLRILKKTNPKYFLLENVVMSKKWENIITENLGVLPIEINSASFSAQNRRRLYWTNIPIEVNKIPSCSGIFIKDIIFDINYKKFSDIRIENTKVITENYVKWDISGKGYFSQQDRAYFLDKKIGTLPKSRPQSKSNIVVDYERGIYKRIHPIEAERAQTLDDNYTEGISETKRLECLGNGWTVNVISFILKGILNEL